jgi:hypothetical protein
VGLKDYRDSVIPISTFSLIFVIMDMLKINILNPKALQLLKDLAALDLIAIQDTSKTGFQDVLKRLRNKEKTDLTLDEITKEVETVRSKRYAK